MSRSSALGTKSISRARYRKSYPLSRDRRHPLFVYAKVKPKARTRLYIALNRTEFLVYRTSSNIMRFRHDAAILISTHLRMHAGNTEQLVTAFSILLNTSPDRLSSIMTLLDYNMVDDFPLAQ